MQVEQFRTVYRENYNKSDYLDFLYYVISYAQADKREEALRLSFQFWREFLPNDDSKNIILNSRIVELVNNSVIDEIPNKRPYFFSEKRTYSFKFTEPVFYNPTEEIKFKIKELCFVEAPIENDKSVFSFIFYHDLNKYEVEQLAETFIVDWKNQLIELGDNKEKEFSQFLLTLIFLLNAENAPIRKTEKKTKQDKENHVTSLYIDLDKEYGKKYLGTVSVKGHLRNQAYGEGFSLRKFIYIAPYEYERMLKE